MCQFFISNLFLVECTWNLHFAKKIVYLKLKSSPDEWFWFWRSICWEYFFYFYFFSICIGFIWWMHDCLPVVVSCIWQCHWFCLHVEAFLGIFLSQAIGISGFISNTNTPIPTLRKVCNFSSSLTFPLFLFFW